MTMMTRFTSRLDLRSGAIDMTHGAGGRAMRSSSPSFSSGISTIPC
jgi:hypothetical protein